MTESSDPFDASFLSIATEALIKSGVTLESGLSKQELENIERLAGFHVPPDLRRFLEFALPTGGLLGHFPEWRLDPVQVLERTRRYLADGIAFDVENGVWASTWGPRPVDTAEAVADVRRLLAAAPPLAPVYGHRFIPAEPWATPCFQSSKLTSSTTARTWRTISMLNLECRAGHGQRQMPE